MTLPKAFNTNVVTTTPATDLMTTSMNQFMIETYCPFFDEFEHLFTETEKGLDESDHKTTFKGHQWDVSKRMKKDFNKIAKWVQDKCREQKIPIKNCKVNMSWCVDYHEGGYQHLHCHGPQELTVVIHLDGQPPIEETPQATHGMLYSIMPCPDGTQVLKNHIPEPGKCVIMDGKVFHGVYPVTGSRRTVVIDINFDWLDPEEKL